jgi:thiol-disulfide isomerase/thioredoxin
MVPDRGTLQKEAEWSEEPGDVHHLEDSNFESFMADNPSVLVMFYAPWCGHCKGQFHDQGTMIRNNITIQ